MIKIAPYINENGGFDGPLFALNEEEKKTVTSQTFDGNHYIYYQGDEPQTEDPGEVLIPNYYGLEQGLFKSALFQKYLNDYNTKGLIFQTTLQNGKDGRDVDQEHLLLGFSAMEINFTQEDVESINAKLQENHFTIRLKVAG